ncbi:MAG: hypothetical protein FWC22_05600 [Treponema sp.]|nr:hypothetical protein [Treponema sp.]
MIKNLKILKRILITFLCTISGIFIILLAAPMLFKNQLMELAKTELNRILLAKVDFKDLKLSFIRNFPNAYIGLDGLEVTGLNEFEGELLAALERFSVTVDIISVIKMDNIEVKSILLERVRLNGIILEDGSANWNIVKTGEDKKETSETGAHEPKIPDADKKESDPFKFKVGLNKFEIRNMEASFRDEKNKMSAQIDALNFILHGDMKKENVDLKLKLAIDGIDFWMSGIRMANKASLGFDSQIAADLKNMDFVIKDNRFNLNEIVLKFDGSAGIRGSDIIADVRFAAERTDFKDLLSLVPAVYMNDFHNIKTTGSLALNGGIKGTYSKDTMPSADVNLTVDNAMFSYPDLPKSVNRINIALRAHYDGEVFDRTTADVDRFSFEIAGNPFYAEAHVKTPESDMQVSARFAGKIDVESITDIIPLEDITLNGLLECDITLAGRLSTLQNEQYEDFQAEGHLKLTGFDFESPDFPQGAQITNLQLNFTPRYVELASLDVVTGSSDISLNGLLENFIPFIFKNETVKGTLALISNNINLNEFMDGGKKDKEETVKEEKGQLSVIEVPKNVDFALTVNIGNILFDKLSITNTAGAVTVRDGKLDMRNLGMNLLEGSLILNGEYNTQNMELPFIDFAMNINQFDISSALASFSFLEKILPEPQNYTGKVSSVLTLYSVLTEHLSPDLDTVNSKGRLQTNNLEIHNSKLFGMVADIIKNESWRNPALGNIDIGFEIKNGRLYIEDPIVFKIQSARLEIKGDQGLDMTVNYRVDVFMPVSVIGSGASGLLSRISGGSNLNEVKLTGYIRGHANDPDINLSMADMAGTITDALRDQVTETITHRVDEVKAQVSEEVNRQIEHLLAEAENQAENIRSGAKQAADTVRKEANAAADKLINDAGANMVQRMLAQNAADLLRNEGEASAKKLEQEGENQAQAVINTAHKKADELRR